MKIELKIGETGRTRKIETRADLIRSMEWLDRRGLRWEFVLYDKCTQVSCGTKLLYFKPVRDNISVKEMREVLR